VNVFVSLDYEIFFGSKSGSIEKTLIEPTAATAEVVRTHGARLSLFVDAGFLVRLAEYSRQSAQVDRQYAAVRRQLETLLNEGHEVQLHIHPHWEDSYWTDDGWLIDTTRYRLHDFDREAMRSILRRYYDALSQVSDQRGIVAFRAGGWVMQPFQEIGDALYELGIRIDSTVFQGGRADSKTHWFDFTDAPRLSRWRFESDPLVPREGGRFLELPIASFQSDPLFFWRMALLRAVAGSKHKPWGDGRAVPSGRKDLVRKLRATSASVVSIDGYRASCLAGAHSDYQNKGGTDFVIIGHPKLLTKYSLRLFGEFLAQHRDEQFLGYRDLLPLAAG
jgi:hypothetical protein